MSDQKAGKERIEHLELSAIERCRIVSLKEGARLRGVSPDTLRRESLRTGKPRIIHISQRRIGVRLDEILSD